MGIERTWIKVKNSCSINIYPLKWRKVRECEWSWPNHGGETVMRTESSNGLILDLLTAVRRLCACSPVEFYFCFNRICWLRQLCRLKKKKNVSFNIQLLFWELPIYEKKKVAPLTFMRNRLNIIINYTVNHLGLGLKGVCLSLKLMYFDSTPGSSSLWIMGKMRASEGRNHSLKWA